MENNMELVPALLKSILTTQEYELTCSQCFELTDQFVELLQSGADAAGMFPDVAQHLSQCPDCDEECQALLSMLQAMTQGHDAGPPNASRRWFGWLTSLLGRNGSQ